jgi:hypothetical protein
MLQGVVTDMSGDERGARELTVGSLLGMPLGGEQAEQTVSSEPASGPSTRLTTEEGPATIAAGELRPARSAPAFRADGVEALTYDNPFNVSIEQVWFDHKVVYAADAGEVDIDPNRVKVAQEYQIVYAVQLDENGKLNGEPERVPGQLNIYDSVPGMEKYSPIWQFNYVVVPRDFRPNSLRSEGDCLTSSYPIHRSQVFEN